MAPRWRLFALGALTLVLVVLWLARQTARLLENSATGDGPDSRRAGGESSPSDARTGSNPLGSRPTMLANAAASQLVIVALFVGLVWYTRIPLEALGLDAARPAVLPGVALGLGLYLLSEAGAHLLASFGLSVDEILRELLAPQTTREWVLLLGIVLPSVAVGEELLFRGALIGALAAGFSLSPWLLVAPSSIAFGIGHRLQGLGGVLVTTGLGIGLGAAFVLTGNLAVVIVAHYVVNALEFVLSELLGLDFTHRSRFDRR